jgi:hypothetical protein
MEILEGFEDLDEEWQEKVLRAIEQGHVDDDDWMGDLEQNRSGKRGKMSPRKKQVADAGETPDGSPKQRKQRKKQVKKEESPASGVDGALPVKDEPDEDGEAPTAPKRGRKRAIKVEEAALAEDVDEKLAKKKAKRAVKKSAPEVKTEQADDVKPLPNGDDDQTAEVAPKKKRGRPAKEPNAAAKNGAAKGKAKGGDEGDGVDVPAPRSISKRAAALGRPTAAASRSRRGT